MKNGENPQTTCIFNEYNNNQKDYNQFPHNEHDYFPELYYFANIVKIFFFECFIFFI